MIFRLTFNYFSVKDENFIYHYFLLWFSDSRFSFFYPLLSIIQSFQFVSQLINNNLKRLNLREERCTFLLLSPWRIL